jgi:hypothetical protein
MPLCMCIREGIENDDQEPGDLPISVHLEPTRMGKCVAYIYLYSSRHANISYRVGDVFLHYIEGGGQP